MTFASSFGRVFSPTFQPSSQAAAVGGWWLSGGIPDASCVAAWSPVGAASYNASLIDLTGHNHALSNFPTAPDWGTTTGWKSGRYLSGYANNGLVSDFYVDNTYTVISQLVCPSQNASAFGTRNSANGQMYGLRVNFSSNRNLWINPGDAYGTASVGNFSGIFTINGNLCYWNKTLDYTFSVTAVNYPNYFAIGNINSGGNPYGHTLGTTIYTKRIAIYNTKITEAQLFAVIDAMNAL